MTIFESVLFMSFNQSFAYLMFSLVLCLTNMSMLYAYVPINEANWELSSSGVEIVEKDGQPAFHFSRGSVTYQGHEFQDGTIEFDMYSGGERAFVYLYFRELSKQDSEVVYLRTHKSNAPDTLQYAPVYQGRSAWQLYHGDKGTAAANLPANTWVRVKLHISGTQLNVWVGDDPKPVMQNVTLTRPNAKGAITLRGNIPRVSQATYSAYIRNIKISPESPLTEDLSPQPPKNKGMLSQFVLSPIFEAEKRPIAGLPASTQTQSWKAVSPQADGVLELLRWRTIPKGMRSWAAAADILLSSPTSQTCALSVGFSDALTLQLNGQTLAFSDASYRFSENRQQGVLHSEQLRLFLPLQAGKNHLRAIIADSFGGWGFQATLSDCPGVTESAVTAK